MLTFMDVTMLNKCLLLASLSGKNTAAPTIINSIVSCTTIKELSDASVFKYCQFFRCKKYIDIKIQTKAVFTIFN